MKEKKHNKEEKLNDVILGCVVIIIYADIQTL